MEPLQKYQAVLLEFIEREKTETCGYVSACNYFSQHKKRYDVILNLAEQIMEKPEPAVLDIGRSQLTHRLRFRFSNVTSLGLNQTTDSGGHRELEEIPDVPHIEFDLKNVLDVFSWPPDSRKFDLIVCAEVVEHLTVPLEGIFLFLHWMLKIHGILLITTPNAVTFYNRAKMLQGINPFELLRFNKQNAGHYREYTLPEIVYSLRRCGYSVKHAYRTNFPCTASDIVKKGPFFSLGLLLSKFPGMERSIVAVATKNNSLSPTIS